MRIRFEKVGRPRKSWVAEYPMDVGLDKVMDDDAWFSRQLSGRLPDDAVFDFGKFYNKPHGAKGRQVTLVFDDDDGTIQIYVGNDPMGKVLVAKKYPRCLFPSFGQSRFEPVRMEALDGKWWWRMYDNKVGKFMPGTKFVTRKKCLTEILLSMIHGRLDFEPDDNRHDVEWLKTVNGIC